MIEQQLIIEQIESIHSSFCFLTDENILDYLKVLEKIHCDVETNNLTEIELYGYLLECEKEYLCDNVSFVQLVESMYIDKFKKCNQVNKFTLKENFQSLSKRLKCFKCEYLLNLEESYKVHILGEKILCKCSNSVDLEQIVTQTIISKQNIDKNFLSNLLDIDYTRYLPEIIPTDFSIRNLDELIKHIKFMTEIKYGSYGLTQMKFNELEDKIKKLKLNPTYFDIDIIKTMKTEIKFIFKIFKNIDFWRNKTNLMIAKLRYAKFMILMGKNNKMLFPTLDISLIWRVHLAMKEKYNKFCTYHIKKKIYFNEYKLQKNVKKKYARTYVKWAELYEEEYAGLEPTYEEYNQGHDEWCKSITLIYPLYRWKRWNNCLRLAENKKLNDKYNQIIIDDLKTTNYDLIDNPECKISLEKGNNNIETNNINQNPFFDFWYIFNLSNNNHHDSHGHRNSHNHHNNNHNSHSHHNTYSHHNSHSNYNSYSHHDSYSHSDFGGHHF